MSDENKLPSALLISADSAVVSSIIENNNSNQVFVARESVSDVLAETNILDGNGIIIFDIDSAEGNVEKAIDQAIQLKKADPTQVLMLVGDKEPLNEILKSSIQPLVYRAFNKPASPNQIFLSFKSAYALHSELVQKQAAGEDIMVVGPAENQTNLDSLAASRKTNPAIYAGIGVLVLGALAFIFLGGDDKVEQAPTVVAAAPEVVQTLDEADASSVSITNELNQQAANALLDGRYTLPKNDNALYYYDQVLAIDPYDPIAYEGRKTVAEALQTKYDNHVARSEFEDALKTLESLRTIEPLNVKNDELAKDLTKAITNRVKENQASGAGDDFAKNTAVLERLESNQDGANSATAALKAEQVLLGTIDQALAQDNLIPPQKGNAYSLVSSALKANKISKTNSQPRVESLSAKLLVLANSAFDQGNTEDVSKYSALVKRLNVDRKGLAALNVKVKAKQDALAASAKSEAEKEAAAKIAAEEAKPEPVKIIPAKIISREAPRYPSRALKSGTEGWVQVKFFIDTKGVPTDVVVVTSEPKGTFDSAAIKSVKKWRFSPARNQATGLPVVSSKISTKVQFRLD
jgi:TonB family protein